MLSLALAAFVLAIPLGTRILLYQATPGFHEYETIFLYGSDILLLVVIGIALITEWRIVHAARRDRAFLPFVIFLTAALFSILAAPSPLLALASFFRLLLLAAFAALFGSLIARRRGIFEKILIFIAVAAVIQSIIGIAQFRLQHAVGLSLLGESPIALDDPGTSRITVGIVHLVRAYGTFPHPNVLAGFLVLGLLALFHFYLHGMGERERADVSKAVYVARRAAVSAAIFIVAVGLTLTFSRAAWLTAFLATFPFVLSGFRRGHVRVTPAIPHIHASSLRFLASLLVMNYLLFAVLGWAAFPRVQVSTGEPAVQERLEYQSIGLSLFRKHPFGVGLGNQVLAGINEKLYQAYNRFASYEQQPTHNLFLLIAIETGIFGLLGFLAFLALLVVRAARGGFPIEKITALTFIGAILVLGLFDHYLWTIEQGRLMLWLAVGLLMGFSLFANLDRQQKDTG